MLCAGSQSSIGSKPRKVLSSLVPQPSPDDADDPDAAAYYNAQQLMLHRPAPLGVPSGHRPGSVKKQRGAGKVGTFSSTPRSDPTARVSPDVFMTKQNGRSNR